MKKKSASFPFDISGISPLLTLWALVTILLVRACRKILVSLTTGTTFESIMSLSTFPAPTLGNWSISPTRITLIFFGTAFISEFISTISIIEDSSTINTSPSRVFLSLRAKPFSGLYSRSLWMVFASFPVASLIRFAARPVGAAQRISLPIYSKAFIMPNTVVVLPVPGSPVSTMNFDPMDVRIASFCTSSYSMPAFWEILSMSGSTQFLSGCSRRFFILPATPCSQW